MGGARCFERHTIANTDFPIVKHFSEGSTTPRSAHRIVKTWHGSFHLFAWTGLSVDTNTNGADSEDFSAGL